MSINYPCIYHKDGYCMRDPEQPDACVFGPCDDETPSNADRIRSMSDEELADAMSKEIMFTVCDAVCEGKCRETTEDGCKRKILEWLQRPAKEE